MRNIPISVILTFPIPNYVDPVTRGPALTIVNGIFIGIVLAALGLRLYTRLFIKRWFGIDDLFIVIATVCNSCPLCAVDALFGTFSLTILFLDLCSWPHHRCCSG